MKIALHWFRCDLRLGDNTALSAATAAAEAVVPIFIFDPVILKSTDTGAPIVAWMLACLDSLQRDIEGAGGKLILRQGDNETEMREVIQATGATGLFFNRDYEPYARKRDASMEKMARALGLEVHSFKDGVMQEAEEVLKADGKPYTMFTPYSRLWRTKSRAAVLPKVRFAPPAGLKEPRSLALPTLKELGFATEITLPPAGEAAAQKRLQEFISEPLQSYAAGRDYPALGGTSRLSPDIRLGTLSVRTIAAATEGAPAKNSSSKKSGEIYVSELIWRDFYRQILWHFPYVADSCFKPQYQTVKWENDRTLFKAWCEGRTGYPLVDAGMRQLNATGWMHNRLRMVVAMFLTKDLLVSYQWGERYFMQKLMDADLASNNGGWQWSASTGTDAQPYFRIFNPMTQARHFDPEGRFIHRFVPEVETKDYPAPIVDHARQRLKALALFRAL